MLKEKLEKIQKYPVFELPQNQKWMNTFAEVQKQHLKWIKHGPVIGNIAHALFKV